MERDHAGSLELLQLGRRHVAIATARGERGANLVEGRALLHRPHEIADCVLGLLQPAARRQLRLRGLSAEPLALEVVLPDDMGHGVGREQLLLQPLQHAPLQLLAGDPAAISARPGFPMSAAAPAIAVDDDIIAAALAAFDEAGEKVTRPLPAGERLGGDHAAHLLRRLPCLVADDPQLWEGGNDPLARVVRP